MSKIVNLGRVRKAGKRAEAAATAAQNWLAHGRNKQEKAVARASAGKADKALAGHKLER